MTFLPFFLPPSVLNCDLHIQYLLNKRDRFFQYALTFVEMWARDFYYTLLGGIQDLGFQLRQVNRILLFYFLKRKMSKCVAPPYLD